MLKHHRRGCFKTVSEKGTVPFCSADSAKSGQSPTVLKLLLIPMQEPTMRSLVAALVLAASPLLAA